MAGTDAPFVCNDCVRDYCRFGGDKRELRSSDQIKKLSYNYKQPSFDQEHLKVTVFKGEDDNDQFEDRNAVLGLIKFCSVQKDIARGSRIHAEVLARGYLERHAYVGTALLSMYAKCGALEKAQLLFNNLPGHNVVSWSSLIAGYVQHGLSDEAFECLRRMQEEGIFPDAVTFAAILKGCGSIGAADRGKEIHADIKNWGLLGKDIVLDNALVDLYAKCGMIAKAQEVFDELSKHDVITWNTLIAGYAQHGLGYQALLCFGQMYHEGVSPDAVTFACILKACGSVGTAKRGKEIHLEVNKRGLFAGHLVLGNALMDMYMKCGEFMKAYEVFNELPVQDVASWNILITGYAQLGFEDEALKCLEQMLSEGVSPNEVTFTCILKACGSIEAVKHGRKIHDDISKQGLLKKHTMVGNALVSMYTKCGWLAKAQQVFDELPERGTVSWSTLIAGYVQHGFIDEALRCFGRMCDAGISPDAVTFACVLKACGSIGGIEIGKEIHAAISKQGLFGKDIILDNALVDMYAKCGSLARTQEVFDELPLQDVVSWSSLMAGYVQHELDCETLKCFRQMQVAGIFPNEITFTVLLTACSRAHLVEEGQLYYNSMQPVFSITPTPAHHACMVDLFGHAGFLNEAMSVIKMVPPSDSLVLWMALLGACQKWVNVALGREAFEHIVELDETYGGSYMCMRIIYSDAGMQKEAKMVEALRIRNKAWKVPGRCWWTDSDRNVHSFVVGDENHPQCELIYAKLEEIHQKLSVKRDSSFSHCV